MAITKTTKKRKKAAPAGAGKARPKHLPENWQKQIIAFREQHGLTWKGLAELMGIHWYSVYRWTKSPPDCFPTSLAWERFKTVKADNELAAKAAKKKGAK